MQFRVYHQRLCRPFQTRFPYGCGPEDLNRAADGNSPDHYAKGTPSRIDQKVHSAPTACRHMVSGSLSSPSRGSSHLSVALLSSLSVVREYLALRDGPRRFSRDSTWPDLLRYPSGGCTTVAYGTVTLYGLPFQCSSASRWLSHVEGPTTPQGKSPRFGLFPFRSPLLGKSSFLSFPAATEMFQLTAFATYAYGFSVRQFGNPGINARLTASPGFSQSSTPFNAS